MFSSDLPPLSEEDKKALRDSVSDEAMAQMCPRCKARIDKGFADAYRRAEEIGLGLRNPLS